jgi:hypothetical protein
MLQTITVQSFSFSIEGLTVTFTKGISTSTLILCPAATCDLFAQLGAIEGFDLDKNNEPVILFTDNQYGRPATGWDVWANFVKRFPLTERMVQIFMEYKEERKAHKRFQGKIKYLLFPLEGAVA